MAEEQQQPQEPQEDSVRLTEVPTQTAPAFQLPDGKVVGMEAYLAWLGSRVDRLVKLIAG